VQDHTAGFLCNICGLENPGPVESFDREVANCSGCGSSGRWRSLIYMLSQELFGATLTLKEFPVLKSIRGLGMSDEAVRLLRQIEGESSPPPPDPSQKS